eukprot:gene15938-18897_t
MPAAFAYCGVQFRSFAGQLGDGAVVSLGEVRQRMPLGGARSDELLELQLKGAGPTPFTREGISGRKKLGSLLKEAVMMEVLTKAGVRTSRAIAVAVGSDEHAIMLRSGESFLRFGTFELANQPGPNGKAGPSCGDYDLLRKIADYAIATLYPDAMHESAESEEAPYRELVLAISEQTARLVASWMCAGWCHGALNTDNLSITGETLDLGTSAFMGKYHPDWVCNSEDKFGLFAYSRQPSQCKKNCMWLAEVLQPLHCEPLDEIHALVEDRFEAAYARAYLQRMRVKLGWRPEGESKRGADAKLVEALFGALENDAADFSTTFVALARGRVTELPPSVARWAEQLPAERKLLGKGRATLGIPGKDIIERVVEQAVKGDVKALLALVEGVQDVGAY